MNQHKGKLIGAVIAAALAFAVYYGLIDQKQANSIQNQANQSLGTTPASQQAGAPTTQNTTTTQNTPATTSQDQPATTTQTTTTPAAPAQQNSAPAPQHQ